MPVYNLLEYSKNYSETCGSSWNYYRDELTYETTDDNGPNKNEINPKSFKYKTSITGSTNNVNHNIYYAAGAVIINLAYDVNKIGTKETEIAVSLKHLGKLWKTLDMPLTNCEVSLTLTWSGNCVITSMNKKVVRAAQGANPEVRDDSPTNATFAIKDTKLYIPVVTLSAQDDNKLLQQLKTGFKRTIRWNKYRSEISNQAKNNNLNYLIDPKFTKFNRLFVLSFENEEDRTSFSKYHVPSVEIKDFNVLNDQKSFFEISRKNKEKAYEKIIEMSRDNDYATGNLLDYEYYSSHYKLVAVDLTKTN